MPYKCRKHNTILANEDDRCDVSDRSQCDIRRVEMIHLMHPEGTGRVAGSGIGFVMSEDKTIRQDVELRLCCTSTKKDALKTPVVSAVTCPKCLEYFESIKKTDEE